MRYISGSKLDERVIRCDLDPGYREGRQFGRGKNGGQVRDEFRQEYDSGRGGWGHQKALMEQEAQDRAREEQQYQTYAGAGGTGLDGGEVPVGEGAERSESLPRTPPSHRQSSLLCYRSPAFVVFHSARGNAEARP